MSFVFVLRPFGFIELGDGIWHEHGIWHELGVLAKSFDFEHI